MKLTFILRQAARGYMASAKHKFQEPTLAVVTGASQGLGRSIAIELAAQLADGSVIATTARSKDGLDETAKMAHEERRNRNKAGEVEIRAVPSDLSKSEDISTTMQSCVKGCAPSQFSSAILIFNFATLGDITKRVCDFRDPDEIARYYHVNVSHLPVLTGQLLDWCKSGEGKMDAVVVNISSVSVSKPVVGMSLYSSGKAARDIMLKVLAAESPNVRVLNYAPGPLLGTRMAETFRTTPNKLHTTKSLYEEDTTRTRVPCKHSAERLLQLLRADKYTSGDHIDYFDIQNES